MVEVSFCILGIAALLPALMMFPSANVTCGGRAMFFNNSKTYSYLNADCLQCPPGMHRINGTQCLNSTSVDHCKCCPNGYYKLSYDNATSCECESNCTEPNTKKVDDCTIFHDIGCDCADGFYYNNENCTMHSVCGRGEGVESAGNKHNDTICIACVENVTFSSTSSNDRCMRCKECELDKIHTRCNITQDTICSPGDDNTTDSAKYIVVVVVCVGVVIIALLVGIVIWRIRVRSNQRTVNDHATRGRPVQLTTQE